jgi:hypothetical protein
MDLWCWLLAHSQDLMMWVGPVVFPMILLTLFLPSLIARSPHARSQIPPIPGIPLMPSQHFRLHAYAFSRDAWRSGDFYQRGVLLVFRIATVLAHGTVISLFVLMVAAEAQAAP